MGTGIGGLSTIEAEHAALNRGRGKVSPLRPADDGQLGRGGLSDRARAPRPVLWDRLGMRGRRPRDRRRRPDGRDGDASACVAGGPEAAITELATGIRGDGCDLRVGDLASLRPPSRRLRDGRGRRGDGAGGRRRAESRGARILGYLTGYGSTADAHHMTAPSRARRAPPARSRRRSGTRRSRPATSPT